MATIARHRRVTGAAALVLLVAGTIAGCDGSEAPGDAGTGTGTSTGPATAPTFVGDPNSEWCADVPEFNSAAAELSQLDLVNGSPTEIEGAFTSMIDELDAVVPAAPPEIADDVKQFAADLGQFRDLLADSGYDIGAAEPGRLAELNTKIAAGSATIDAYNRSVCANAGG